MEIHQYPRETRTTSFFSVLSNKMGWIISIGIVTCILIYLQKNWILPSTCTPKRRSAYVQMTDSVHSAATPRPLAPYQYLPEENPTLMLILCINVCYILCLCLSLTTRNEPWQSCDLVIIAGKRHFKFREDRTNIVLSKGVPVTCKRAM